MLERYFKSEKEFDEYLDRTYDPEAFERSFEEFLQDTFADHGNRKNELKKKGVERC